MQPLPLLSPPPSLSLPPRLSLSFSPHLFPSFFPTLSLSLLTLQGTSTKSQNSHRTWCSGSLKWEMNQKTKNNQPGVAQGRTDSLISGSHKSPTPGTPDGLRYTQRAPRAQSQCPASRRLCGPSSLGPRPLLQPGCVPRSLSRQPQSQGQVPAVSCRGGPLLVSCRSLLTGHLLLTSLHQVEGLPRSILLSNYLCPAARCEPLRGENCFFPPLYPQAATVLRPSWSLINIFSRR